VQKKTPSVLLALLALYAAQGIPFGIAAEYLPVVMRSEHYSQTAIAAAAWLQLPWQLKVLWASLADREHRVSHARILLCIQVALAALLAGYGFSSFQNAPMFWFVLTALLALVASTQDVFVDALAVRTLPKSALGLGNSVQVAGYRAGMLIGGAALLIVSSRLGLSPAMLLTAGIVLASGVVAFMLTEARAAQADAGAGAEEHAPYRMPAKVGKPEKRTSSSLVVVLRHAFSGKTALVIAFAATFKLGLHMASGLIKPMVVDAGWSRETIGIAVVTYGTAAGFVGAAVGGLLHRAVSEHVALGFSALAQALCCVPLIAASYLHVPYGLSVLAIASEHFVSGLGTTVLFAALMSATRKTIAGAHYTLLTSANAVAIGVGGMAGGLLADKAGRTVAFSVAAVLSLLPIALLVQWQKAASHSAEDGLQ
jgi:MFS transporter, PAT family, beta-lactamase induction signal transducer AmpG